MLSKKKEIEQKEYCECCKKTKVPEKIKLKLGGYLHVCPECGLVLSVTIGLNVKKKLKL
jgi:uncharacterized Zn finger protein